jgi:hypothetical protein
LAIKVLYTRRDSGPFLRRLATEAQILQELDHDHIVKCRGFVQRTGQAPYLVTRFEHGGALADHIERVGPLSPKIACGVLRQVMLALDVAHQRGVVHRDLKPENVLLAATCAAHELPHVRVADFGIAKVAGGVGGSMTRVGSFIGTPEFAAPEQFRGEAPSPATDVFAAGGLLIYLLTARLPFTFSHRLDLESSYQELMSQLPPRLPPEVDPTGLVLPGVQELIDLMMVDDPTRRLTTRQVLVRLDVLLGRTGSRGAQTVDLTGTGAPPRLSAPAERGATPVIPTLATVAGQEAPALSRPPEDEAPARAASPKPAPRISQIDYNALDAEPERRSGCGLLGITAAFGGLGVVVVGVVGLGLLALGGAWYVGLFSGAPPAPELPPPPPVVDAGPLTLDPADPASRAVLEPIQARLTQMGPDLARVCVAEGAVEAQLELDAAGTVTRATLRPGALAPEPRRCVAARLQGLSLPNPSQRPLHAQVTLPLKR